MWMQSLGLEWMYRLAHEPRRLWRRYVIGNPRFAVLFSRQLITRIAGTWIIDRVRRMEGAR
jgi:N-acetylglucosaminyldiphosphoundecaprenol N-acetyl-beta-D-mannosaminyltransferase